MGVLFYPLGPPPSSTAGPGDFGEDCLRPKGPSSAAARLGEQRREPRRAVDRGGFLWLTFFSRLRK